MPLYYVIKVMHNELLFIRAAIKIDDLTWNTFQVWIKFTNTEYY